jgi:hypothetical protein
MVIAAGAHARGAGSARHNNIPPCRRRWLRDGAASPVKVLAALAAHDETPTAPEPRRSG